MAVLVACARERPAGGAERPPRERPNLVVLLSDDSGYSDLGCYGGEIRTPHIDRLAEAGLRFRTCYNSGRCSPTRAALLTGQDPHTVGVGDLCNVPQRTPFPAYRGFLSPDHPTLAELLRDAGYHTLLAGKWHLGGDRRDAAEPRFAVEPEELAHWPTRRGFERFFGLIHGSTDKFAGRLRRPYFLGEEVYQVEQHPGGFFATDAFTDFAVEFVEAARQEDDRPIFLLMAYSAPHVPLQAPEDAVRRYVETYAGPEQLRAVREGRVRRLRERGLLPPTWSVPTAATEAVLADPDYREEAELRAGEMAAYAGMMTEIDRSVGRVTAVFERLGELDDTLILYLSDNGAPVFRGRFFNTPFSGVKGSLDEGAIRTHLIAHWPGRVRPGLTRQVAHVHDFLPTFLELAGAVHPESWNGRPLPAPEGLSLLPVLDGGTIERGDLAWDLYDQRVVLRDGRWKWSRGADGKERLYDLEHDGAETTDLAADRPELVEELRAVHRAYRERTGVVPYAEVRAAQSLPSRPASAG